MFLINLKIEEFSLQLVQRNMKIKAWRGLFVFDYKCLFDVSISYDYVLIMKLIYLFV